MNSGTWQPFLSRVQGIQSPLLRQLYMVGLITRVLAENGKPAPIIIGDPALSYYSREVYFTADIDLAYADREALNRALRLLGFEKQGRYWIHRELDIAVEVPASSLAGEDSPLEVVDLEDGLSCTILGLEDLIIDRLNACKHWKSEPDREMVELLIMRYHQTLDWPYLESRATAPENNSLAELLRLKNRKP